MRLTLFTCCCLLLSLTACAQQLSGLVIAGPDRISGALIYNTRTQAHVTSNVHGEFYLSALPGDTLVITKPGYQSNTVVVKNETTLIITLSKPANELKEVVITGNKPSPQAVYEQNKQDFKQIYRIGDKSHIIALTPLGPGIRIDPLYSALSRQGKNARKLQRTLNSDYKNSVIDHRFTPTLVGRITGYRDTLLQQFMYKYRPSYEMVIKASDYELMQYIKEKMTLER